MNEPYTFYAGDVVKCFRCGHEWMLKNRKRKKSSHPHHHCSKCCSTNLEKVEGY